MNKYSTIEFDVADHIATITLNRPERLNSFNQQMLEDFRSVWAYCRGEDDVHVVVLRANGDRAFSTGVDRKDGRTRHTNPWSQDDPGYFLGPKQNRVWKPVIAAVNGMCAGGAFYWVNEADIVVCSEDATFFDPHTTYGMVSALEPAGMLRRMPFGEVMRIALFGLDERMSARRAREVGLVSEVLTTDELWPRAAELAARLASKPPLAVQGTVKAIWDSMSMSVQGAREIPLQYPQIGNTAGQIALDAAVRPEWELRE